MKKIFFIFFSFIAVPNLLYAQSWIELGTGSNALNANGDIFSICADHSGNIYAGGGFYDAAGHLYVGKWNGTSWSELGPIYSNDTIDYYWVSSLCVDATGNLYAAGEFDDNYGYNYVAEWNGTSWSQLGPSSTTGLLIYGTISSICTDKFGNVYAAAGYYDLTSTPRTGVLKWNGGAWSELGSGPLGLNANDDIESICTDTFGNVYAAGDFSDISGQYYVAKWNGSSWSELGQGFNSIISSICSDNFGNIYAGGSFYDTVTGLLYVGKWDGTSWTKLETGIDPTALIFTICVDTAENVYAAGNIGTFGGYSKVIKWDGTMWGDCGTGVSDSNGYGNHIHTLCINNTDNVFAAGSFYDANSKYYVAENISTTGVPQQLIKESSLLIYPNPNRGTFSLLMSSDFDELVIITITNIVGEKITELKTTTNKKTEIQIYAQPGIYFISAVTKDETLTEKILVE